MYSSVNYCKVNTPCDHQWGLKGVGLTPTFCPVTIIIPSLSSQEEITLLTFNTINLPDFKFYINGSGLRGYLCSTFLFIWDSSTVLYVTVVHTFLFSHHLCIYPIIFFIFYLFMRDTQRKAETQAEGEAGSMQGAWRGTRSWDPGVTPWAAGRCSTAEPPRAAPENPSWWNRVGEHLRRLNSGGSLLHFSVLLLFRDTDTVSGRTWWHEDIWGDKSIILQWEEQKGKPLRATERRGLKTEILQGCVWNPGPAEDYRCIEFTRRSVHPPSRERNHDARVEQDTGSVLEGARRADLGIPAHFLKTRLTL